VDPRRVDHFESITRHDVIAFTTAVAERIGPISRYIHFGLTSSDVVDTALSLLIQEAGQILREDILELLKTLESQAKRYRDLPTIGRSHGIFAEPTSFGLKFLGWYAEWQRNLERLDEALERCRYGKLSGAVGVNPHWGPRFEERVLGRLGLKREPVSTQVIPRDRHAEILGVFAMCGSSLERIAVELRHLQRSEVGEVLESFQKGQKGSSAMPHKRNPISSENLTGAARLLRAYAQTGLENIALWHERDISHSSVERITFPDATILLDYALARMNRILSGLTVREENVKANLDKAGLTVFSGHFLLALVKAGVTREDAYAWVQSSALASLEGRGDFIELLEAHEEIGKYLTAAKIRRLGSMKFQLRHVRDIYASVLSSRKSARRKRS
jgi:adenylosuccinate lyase